VLVRAREFDILNLTYKDGSNRLCKHTHHTYKDGSKENHRDMC